MKTAYLIAIYALASAAMAFAVLTYTTDEKCLMSTGALPWMAVNCGKLKQFP